MDFDPVEFVKGTSRVGYLKFDPLSNCSKMNFAPLSYQSLHRKFQVDQFFFLEHVIREQPENMLCLYGLWIMTMDFMTMDHRLWFIVHFACISNTWWYLLHILNWIKVHSPRYAAYIIFLLDKTKSKRLEKLEDTEIDISLAGIRPTHFSNHFKILKYIFFVQIICYFEQV